MKMKKIFLIMSVTASLFMTGCSQDEPDPNGGNGDDISDGNTSYMAVNMISSDDMAPRSGGYEFGTTAENKVTSVRFYFFTANGQPANVKLLNNAYVNFYDWETGIVEEPGSGDVEKRLKATIVINTKQGDKLPQQIVAVLNPTTAFKNDVNSKNLSDLKAIVRDFAHSDYTKEGSFVMFNSVYGNDAKTEEICAVQITKNNLQTTEDAAKANPVTLYVERSVAKVGIAFASGVGTDLQKIALKDKDGNALKIGNEQVYLKIEGWDLTAETSNGRLVKAIDLSWTTSWWNNGTHRSCWALNSPTAENKYYDYTNGINTAISTSLYTNENAAYYPDETGHLASNHTKFIIKGTLIRDGGGTFTIVRHLGSHFADTYSATPSENLPELKKNILSQLSAGGYFYYYETTEDSKTVRKQIDTTDLLIVPATQINSENSSNNCYVYAQLTEDAKKKTWYSSSNIENKTVVSSDVINGNLKNKEIIDWALVWKDGMTYYYSEIIHNDTDEDVPPTMGVVRNHVYKINVNKIAGLGTPVYDPSKTIYPEKPDPNDHYIAAEINILAWHIVTNDYPLVWD